MLRQICLRLVRGGTGGKCSTGIYKKFSKVEMVGDRVERERREYGGMGGGFDRLKYVGKFGEALFLVRGVAVNGVDMGRKERSYYHFMLRRSGFFEKCSLEEFRIFALETFKDDFGSGNQQVDIKDALMRILVEDVSLPGIKIELCLEVLEKYLAVYKNITDKKLRLGLYELPLSYINSSLEYCSLNQLIQAHYYNSYFLVEDEEWIKQTEKLIFEKITKEGESLKKVANNWILVNLLWSISSTRYHHHSFELSEAFHVAPESVSVENFEVFKSTYEELRSRRSSLNPAQVNRFNLASLIMNNDKNCQGLQFELFKHTPSSSQTVSRVHKDVIAVLRASGHQDLQFEKELLNGLVSVDVYIPSRNTAFEVNGPFHFIPESGENWDILNTPSIVKYGLLWEMGYRVVPINSEDWNKLKGMREKENYFKKIFGRIEFYC